MTTEPNKYKFGNLHLKNAKEVSDYTSVILAEAENLITNVIPDKIFSLKKLDEDEFKKYQDITSVTSDVDIPQGGYEHFLRKGGPLVTSHNNHDNNHSTTTTSPGKKKRKISQSEASDEKEPANGGATGVAQIPCNAKLLRLIDLMKPEIKDVIQACESIKMWISLLIPRIEDGNNFGVSIQEEVLNEVHRIETESISYLDAISRYFITRAKIISKVAKYPFVDDYNRAVKEVDEKEYLNIQFSCNEIRSHYLLILDVVSKNYEKIKKPRSSNNLESMY